MKKILILRTLFIILFWIVWIVAFSYLPKEIIVYITSFIIWFFLGISLNMSLHKSIKKRINKEKREN